MSTGNAERVRLGILGCGAIGRIHVERLVADPRIELAVFCDPRESSACQLRDRCAPEAAVETEPERALDPARLDAAVIASPTFAHYAQTCLALDRGLDVLCEKPLAEERSQILDLIERHRRRGKVLTVSYQRRYQAPYRTARRELTERADRYGPVRQVHVYVCERWQQTIANTWRDDPKVGGYFADAGNHQIDVVRFVSGLDPESVYVHSERRGSTVEIVTGVMARLHGGAGLAAHFVGDANHWREDIHFHGRDADLLLRSGELFCCRENRIEPIRDLLPESTPDRAFVDALVEGAPTVSPPEVALPIHDWTRAVLRSIQTRSWTTVCPTGDPHGQRGSRATSQRRA